MRISTLSASLFGLMVAASVSSCILAIWQVKQSREWDTRVGLANASYAEHLVLQGNLRQLVAMQRDSSQCTKDRNDGLACTTTRSRIAANITEIRRIINAEIELVGETEAEELNVLARIEAGIGVMTLAMSRLNARGETMIQDESIAATKENHPYEMGATLDALITQALDGERAEVTETLSDAEASRTRIYTGSIAITLASIVFAVFSTVAYVRLVVRPSMRLAARIEAYRNGKSNTPHHIGGVWELRLLSHMLDAMIAALNQRDANRQEHNESLEQAVLERTNELSCTLIQMEQAEENRRRMMADVSHELRTPLTIIQGEAEVSLRGIAKSVDTYCDSLARIRDTARHAGQVVNDLLLIARQESGKLRLDLQIIDLCAVVRDTVALFPRVVTPDLAIVHAEIQADQMRIRQCLLALIQNARRYGGDKIWIKVEPCADGYALVVEGNGEGLNNTEKAQAFERYFRGSNAAHVEIDGGTTGTGLGLPIVRAIALAHGGTVTLQDRKGGGLRVMVILGKTRPFGLALCGDNVDVPQHLFKVDNPQH